MAPFPPPPVSTIDWSNVGFKVREVNGHVESTFRYSSPTPQWSKPRFVTSPHLSIHGMAPGLNYGVQCYEGMKAFRQPDGSITIFRPDQNALRMQRSAEFISIPPVPVEHFLECVNLAVSMNAEFVPPHETGAAMYIRPLLFGSSAQLGLNPPDEYTFVVFVMPTGVYHGVHAVDALILEDFDRAAPEGTGSAKVGGNYAPVLRHSEKARSQGYGITLHLDSKTRSEIDEFSTSGFLGVRKDGDKTTIVVPDSKNVIKSVTSESACQIAKDILGYSVEKRRIDYSELPQFIEIMAAGTAASLVPIKSITMKSKGDRFEYPVNEKLDPGPVCAQLLSTLKGIQMGKVKDQFAWNMKVTEPSKEFAHSATNGGVHGGVDDLP
ncbi:branched-chain amino acid aminotransferase [Cladophialophora bantiana CBS 173.52]|uniref:Branched-chain amino acid aminotransferase n=1 Tax=Cladophialophora bantiana (strain ATCC 10958 / CBS 173.52 / CDC B-1940 / NIH 8579) TaxID=1442370 RepID=A0A0D2HSX4_CLAB1|nr:branched-chain amino acid aminotransferase [Cladophialophora bantiana CBS 173.52]KIW96563.1 branched-chain amino acid aminotransferase [Cladophialophora bantiana CBS 173.52]